MNIPEILLKYQPIIAEDRFFLLLYDKQGKILWWNKRLYQTLGYNHGDLIGHSISELVWVLPEYKSETFSRFFDTGRTGFFKLLLKKDVGLSDVSEGTAYFMGNLHSIESNADTLALDQDNYLAFFNVGINYRVAYFNNFSNDLFAMLNPGYQLIEYNQQFFTKFFRLMGGALNYRGKTIGEFFTRNDWEFFKERQCDKKQYLEECVRIANGPWAPVYHENFSDNSREKWNADTLGLWTMDGNELHGVSKHGFSFCVYETPVDASSHDVKIEFSVRCGSGTKFGCFVSGRHEHYTFSPDSSGYYLGADPESMVVKKCGMKMSLNLPHALQDGGWHKAVVEKTGARLTLDIDGQSRVEFFDLQPIVDPSLNACGLSCGADTSFKDFRISDRPSTMRISGHPAFERFDMHLKDFPEEIYEVSLYPGFYQKKPVEIMHLRDITQLRTTQEELKKKSLEHKRLLTKHQQLKRKLDSGTDAKIIGTGSAMEKIRSLIRNTADTLVSILITGETGTGKDLVAQQLHFQSSKHDEPFIKVDCASLPPQLLESELFGYEKGAFTGAFDRKIGRFEAAGNGTVFLDEISNLEPSLQAKLLRVLQDKKFERIGSNITLTTEARIISASNQDLDSLITSGRFRKDLYFRINTIIINTPPLRERLEDIPELTLFFIREYCEKHQKTIPEITPRAMHLLCRYSWPGNIRELENAMEHAFVRTKKDVIEVFSLPQSLRTSRFNPGQTASPALASESAPFPPQPLTREAIEAGLAKVRYNRSRLAKALGVSRTTLWKKMREFGM